MADIFFKTVATKRASLKTALQVRDQHHVDHAAKAESDLEALQLASIDIEQRHKQADAIICGLLTACGYASVVAEYDAIDKEYG